MIKFKCEPDGKFTLICDNRAKFKDYKQVTIQETLEREKERLTELYDSCVDRLRDFIVKNPYRPYTISVSGGKDSELTMAVWKDAIASLETPPEYEYLYCNTTNEVGDVYRRIKAIPGIRILNPKVGWWQWLQHKNYLFPSIYRRSCCEVYKEGQVKKAYPSWEGRVQVLGLRRTESNKRAQYQFYMDAEFDKKIHGKTNFFKNWVKLSPIVELETVEVWLLILLKDLPVNRRYRLGSSRVGCFICPYSNTYEDELARTFYKSQWDRFVEAITKNYNNSHAKTLGWTLDEWINGAWKTTLPKHMLKNLKPTPENIKALAERKGISEDMAAKYFDRHCGVCGKWCSENEISMFFKLFGRFEGKEDKRNPFCKKHLCEKYGITLQEYHDKLSEFYDSDCNLF